MRRPGLLATLLVLVATVAVAAVVAWAGGISARQAGAAVPRPASAGNGVAPASQPGDCVDVWALNFSRRGLWIDEALGGDLPPTFPTIDRFVRSEGTATSIKSVDLSRPSYQSQADLERLLRRYIDKVASFRGAQRANVLILARQVKARALLLAIPTQPMTKAQRSALARAAAYARSHGVRLTVRPVAGVRVSAGGNVELCEDPAAPAPGSWWLTAPLAWQQAGNGQQVLRPHHPRVGEHGPGVAVLPGQPQPVLPPAAGVGGKPPVGPVPQPPSSLPLPRSRRHPHHNTPALPVPAPAPTTAPSPPVSVPAMPPLPGAQLPFSPLPAPTIPAPLAPATVASPGVTASPPTPVRKPTPRRAAPPAPKLVAQPNRQRSSSHPPCLGLRIASGVCVPPAVSIRREPPPPPPPPAAAPAPHYISPPAPAHEPASAPVQSPSPVPVHHVSPPPAPAPPPVHHVSPPPSPPPPPHGPALGHRNQCLGCEPLPAPAPAPAPPPPRPAPPSSGCGGVDILGLCIDPIPHISPPSLPPLPSLPELPPLPVPAVAFASNHPAAHTASTDPPPVHTASTDPPPVHTASTDPPHYARPQLSRRRRHRSRPGFTTHRGQLPRHTVHRRRPLA